MFKDVSRGRSGLIAIDLKNKSRDLTILPTYRHELINFFISVKIVYFVIYLWLGESTVIVDESVIEIFSINFQNNISYLSHHTPF